MTQVLIFSFEYLFLGTECIGDWLYDSTTQLCYRYMANLARNFWRSTTFCTLATSIPAAVEAKWCVQFLLVVSSVVQLQNLMSIVVVLTVHCYLFRPAITGQDLWVNGFRYNLSDSKFYSYPSKEERTEYSGLASSATGRCVTVRSDGTTHTYSLMDCDSPALNAVCVQPKGMTSLQPSGNVRLTVYLSLY